jgi:hypothetical protein
VKHADDIEEAVLRVLNPEKIAADLSRIVQIPSITGEARDVLPRPRSRGNLRAGSPSTEKKPVDLTLAIVAINGWNRIAIGFRAVPGAYG